MNRFFMLKDFEPLFLPNHSRNITDQLNNKEYRRQIINRMLAGENVSYKELGIKQFVLESGRLSGKTQHDEYAAAIEITKGIGDMWYCRSELGDIRNSIFTSMQTTLHGLGYTLSDNLTANFHVSRSPFEITHNRTNNKIQFMAINKDINRTKGFVAPSRHLKRVMVEEANEVDEGKYIDALTTTAMRFMDAESKMTYRLNPPETKQHWSVKYFRSLVEDGAQKIYTTWEQLAKLGMLNPATVAEVLKKKQSDPLFYDYWYLGKIVNLQGLVFRHFDSAKHCVRVDKSRLDEIVSHVIISGDAANKNDPTCFGALCVLLDGRILVLDAMYYDPRIKGQLDDVALGREVCDWYDKFLIKYPKLKLKKHIGTVDNANWNLMRMLEVSKSLGWFRWTPATDKLIVRDTKRLQTLFREDILLFNVATDNSVESITNEIENFIYDPKTHEIKKNQDDHGIDMLKYGTFLYADTKIFF